jgi:hypothetical protein
MTDAAHIPLPSYRTLFRLATWLENTVADWPWDLSEPDDRLMAAHDAISELAFAACAKEGKNFTEMLHAIHAGEFGDD